MQFYRANKDKPMNTVNTEIYQVTHDTSNHSRLFHISPLLRQSLATPFSPYYVIESVIHPSIFNSSCPEQGRGWDAAAYPS